MTQRVSIGESHNAYLDNVKRHEGRAAYWMDQGKPEYAAGSMRKAANWRRHYRAADMFWNGPLPPSPVQIFIKDRLHKRVLAAFEDTVLNGDESGLSLPGLSAATPIMMGAPREVISDCANWFTGSKEVLK